MSDAAATAHGDPGGTPAPRLVLVGPPGSGKSSVGAVLARRWSTRLVDTDTEIEQAQGRSVSEIFVDDGEETFRALERAAVDDALRQPDVVVSLGGGAVLAAETRALLANHRVVFLDVGLAAAGSRVGLGVSRPLLLGNVRGRLKALMDARRPLYEQVATARVDTDALDVDQVADLVERVLADG
jgi:shikimate kinase